MAASSVVDVVKNAERLAAFFTADRTQEEHLETVRQFLEPFSKENRYRIINCKLERYNGRTVVHLAASAGHHLSLRELLKRGGDPNRESSAADLKQTPLHISARSRRPKCFQVLLQHGALIDHPNQNKETPRQLAKGLPGIDNVIKAYFAKYEEPKRSPEDLQVIEELHMLAEEESHEALDRFIDLFVSLKPFMQDLSTRFTDFEQTTLVCRICNHLNQPLLNKLMEFTQSPELLHNLSDNKNPLHIVTECGSTEMAEMLIARWPDLVFQTVPPLLTPFHLACYTQTKEMVDVFLRGIALILADYNEEVPLDLNVIDGAGHTPLHHACYNRDCGPIVDALLSFKPEHSNFVSFDVNAVSVTKHRSVLHIAVSREKSNFLLDRLLKEKGINISLKACPSSSTVKTVTSHWYELAERKGKALSPALQDTGEDRPPTVRSLTTPTRFSPIADVVSGSPEEDEVRELRADVPERGLPVSRSQTVVAEISASTRKVKLRKRSKTEEEGGGKGEFSVNPSLYCSPHGGLEIHASGTEPVEYTSFNQLRMTSLTEACLVGNRTAVEKLLCAGAKANKSTIELLQALEQWDMLQFVLSYHTKMVDYSKQNEMKDNHLQLASKGLKLLWSSLHLTELVGEWFVDGCGYRPLVEKKEGREITICSYPNLPPVVLSDTITEVDIPDNALERIPIELLQLPHLRHLNLSRNSLESLPVAAHRTTLEGVGWRCKELTSLLLSGNKFQELPQVLWKMPRLKELLAANNALRTLGIIHQSEQSEMSQSLEKVDLSENCLDYVSDFLFLLDSVKNVNLSTNSLHSLPEVVWDCVSLEVLDVSKNKLRELPLCETDQSMMTSPLDNYSTNHSPVTMPRSKAQGYHHTGAYLEVSVSLRSTFKRRTQTFLKTEAPKSREGIQDSVKVQADDPSKLRVLKLSHNELSHFPCALPCLAPHLQELDVSFNGSLVEIDIAYLPSRLKELTATNCGIERFGNILPPNVRSYVKRTCRIPDQFGPGKNCIHRSHEQLEYLQKLYLNNNKMEKLPLMRRRPTKLESSLRSSLTANEWHAPEEEITNRDPDEVASGDTKRDDLLFPNVHTVIVSNNRLVGCLNPNVGFLANLHTLSVSNNEALTHLPKELAYLKKQGRGMKLNSLIFADLPNLKDPPPQYQGKPLNHLMSYFRSALKK
jgi:Leucine-rich repeat (LRR) protein/ankyrin repeat protein